MQNDPNNETASEEAKEPLDWQYEPPAIPKPDTEPEPELPLEPPLTSEPSPAQETKEPTLVPLAALQDERTKRQVLEEQLKERNKRFDEILNALLEQSTKPDKPEPAGPEFPDFNVDPLGHLQAKIESLSGQLSSFHEDKKKEVQERSELDKRRAFTNRWMQDVQSYHDAKPDLGAALIHLADSRTKELTALGYDQEEIKQILGNDAQDLATRAYNEMEKTGKRYNPVEKLYNLAVLRGYTPANSAPATASSPSRRSPHDVRGFDVPAAASPTSALSAEAIANMSEEEYDELRKRVSWKRLNSF